MRIKKLKRILREQAAGKIGEGRVMARTDKGLIPFTEEMLHLDESGIVSTKPVLIIDTRKG